MFLFRFPLLRDAVQGGQFSIYTLYGQAKYAVL